MNHFYEWLYDCYAEPKMDEALLHPIYQEHKQAWQAVADKLSPDDAFAAADFIECLKIHWGTLAFAHGIKVGFMLSAGLAAGPQEVAMSRFPLI